MKHIVKATWKGFGMIGVVSDPQALQGVLSHQEEAALQEVSIQLGFRFENYADQNLMISNGSLPRRCLMRVDALLYFLAIRF